jgi:hypothetical protein
MGTIIGFAVAVLFVGLVVGFLCWAIRTAPFIPSTFKEIGVWFIIVLGVLVLLMAAYNALGGGGGAVQLPLH